MVDFSRQLIINRAILDERNHGAHQAERMQSDDHHSKAVTRIKLNAVSMHYPWEEKGM